MISPELRMRIEDRKIGAARAAALEPVWDLVWLRRGAHFATFS
jgi:hypothetical protein